MGYSRKKPGGVEDILFVKKPWNFSFFYFTPGNSRQNKAAWKFHIIFLTLGIFGTSFLFISLKFHMLSLWCPWKFHILLNHPPTVCFFSGISQFSNVFYLFVKKSGIMNYPYVNDAFPLLNTQQKQNTFINFLFIIDFHAVSFPQRDGKIEETVVYLVI